VEYERPYPIDGHITWMLVRKTGLTRPDGSRVVVLLLLNVTERKAAEERLRASEQRFRSLTQLSADWYWEQDAQLRFTYVSSGGHGKAALPPGELLGKSRFELNLEWGSETARQEHMATLQAHRPFRDVLVHHGGTGQWVMVSGEPVFDARGEFTGYRGVGRDVTSQKQAEHELAEGGKFLDALISAIPTPVTVKDREHRYIHVNDAFCQLAGLSREALVGHDDSVILPPEEVEFVWKLDREALSSDNAVQYEHTYLLNGQSRWMLVRKYALPRPDGNLVVVSSLVDISNLKAVEAALRASEARLRSLLDLSADWMWEQDASYRYTYLSAEAPSKGGIDPDTALGKTLLELPFRWEADECRQAHVEDLEFRRTFRDLHLMQPDPDGRTRHISVSGEPIFGARGEFVGYRGTGQDITERKLTERRIARLKDMYAAMTEANDAIIHSKDTGQLFLAICRIVVEYGHFLFARIALIDHQTGWVRTVASAGDHKGYADQFTVSIDASRPEGQGPSAHAIRTGSNYVSNDITGDPRNRPWRETLAALGVRAQAAFLLHREGRVIGALHLYADQVGFFDDELTGMLEKLAVNLSFALDNFQREQARRAAEAALRESETRFRDFADAAGEYVWEADLESRYTYVSSRVQSVWSYTDQELIGHTAYDFMPPGEAERVREWVSQNARPDGSFRDLEHRILTRNADTRWLLVNAVGIFDESGQLIGLRGTGRDITDRKTAEARISYLATRDPLTELPNRVLFNDRLEQGIVAARRSGQSLAVLFIDLDRFKYINDSLGHQVGDLLLKEVATRMYACIRKGDTLSRLGGDEFVVTLEGLQHAEDAAQVAGKIIKALARPFEIAGHTLTTSCSIGIAIFPLDADDDRSLMKNGHGDVSRQGERPQQLPVLLAGDERACGRTPQSGDRPAPGHRAPGVRTVLPAAGQHSHRSRRRDGGAAALAAPRARPAQPHHLHRCGRGVGLDRADRTMGAAKCLPARQGLAGYGLSASQDCRQYLSAAAQSAARVLQGAIADPEQHWPGPRYLELEMTSHCCGRTPREHRSAAQARPGRDAYRSRRLRHRLLVAVALARLAVECASRSTAASCATSRPTPTPPPSSTPWLPWRTASSCR
jgi:diguanylate cyclase (GGDEF)-like protein/PAS domain S-box-containing protein